MLYENMLKMRGFAMLAAAGYCLVTGTPAQACRPVQSNINTALAPAVARLANPLAKGLAGEAGGEAKNSSAASLVGMWDTTFLAPNNVVIDEGYEIFHSDGTEITIDIAPPATDNVCIGVYVQTGPFAYSLTHVSWTFDAMGNLTGTANFQVTVNLAHSGQSFTGTYAIDTYDLTGAHNGHYEGTLTAKRISPQ